MRPINWEDIYRGIYVSRIIANYLENKHLKSDWEKWKSKYTCHQIVIDSCPGRFGAFGDGDSVYEGHDRHTECKQFLLDCLTPEYLESFKMWLDEKEVQEL